MGRGLTLAAGLVLDALAHGVQYGFDIMDRTGLPSGTVYPALSRFERDGLVRSDWEDAQYAHREKRPPRRYYEITAAGERALAEIRQRVRALGRARARRRPAPSRS